MAIKKAFLLFLPSISIHNKALAIKSDSKVAVGWVLNLVSAPWCVRNSLVHIENLKKQTKEWSIVHVL
ncbi:hypothetical protein DITRI_Ditri13aG0065300 [Diplodiscus trichospermus]